MSQCRFCSLDAVCEVHIEGIPVGGLPRGMYPIPLCAEHRAAGEIEPGEIVIELEPKV